MLSPKEKLAIEAYKAAASKLPHQEYLTDYALPDYTETQCSISGRFDDLSAYLVQARHYSRLLELAATLREQHYLAFIRDIRVEDPGHSIWRRGLSLLAEDAASKVSKWGAVSDTLFHELMAASTPQMIDIPDAEYSYIPEVPLASTSCAVLQLSAAEKRRRKNRRASARKKRLRDEKLLIAAFKVPEVNSVDFLAISDIYALVQSEMPMLHVHSAWLFHSSISVGGTREEKQRAASYIVRESLLHERIEQYLLTFILCRDREFREAMKPHIMESNNFAAAAAVWITSSAKERSQLQLNTDTSIKCQELVCIALATDIAAYAVQDILNRTGIVRNTATITYLLRCVQTYYESFQQHLEQICRHHAVHRRFGKNCLSVVSKSLELIRACVSGDKDLSRYAEATKALMNRSSARVGSAKNVCPPPTPEETRRSTVTLLLASLASQCQVMDLSGNKAESRVLPAWKDTAIVIFYSSLAESKAYLLTNHWFPRDKVAVFDYTSYSGKLCAPDFDPEEMLLNFHMDACYIYERPAWAK